MKFIALTALLLLPAFALAEDARAPLWNNVSKGQSLESIKKSDSEFTSQGGDLHKDEIINGSCHIHVKISGDHGFVSKVTISHGGFNGDNIYYCRKILISILQKKYGYPYKIGQLNPYQRIFVWKREENNFVTMETLYNTGDIVTYSDTYPKNIKEEKNGSDVL